MKSCEYLPLPKRTLLAPYKLLSLNRRLHKPCASFGQTKLPRVLTNCASDALSNVQKLASRIGDDSNLTLDPDLDTYYVQKHRRRPPPKPR